MVLRLGRLFLVVLGACSAPDSAGGDRGGDEVPTRERERAKEGDELIGTPAPGWSLERWFNSPPLTLADLRGKVVLVRWFMSPDCPFCSATAPSLNLLDDKYRGRGLAVVGLYHHKGQEPLDPEAVKGYLEHYKFRFPVAIDPDWKTLKRWWLDRERGWTSVSFLLDRAGVIRFIHPGGKYAPGSADLAGLEREIEALLAQATADR